MHIRELAARPGRISLPGNGSLNDGVIPVFAGPDGRVSYPEA